VNLSNLNFLVVDDDDAILGIVIAGLKNFGATQIVECANGAEANDILSDASRKFDCIVSDFSMAPVSGLELLKNVRTGRYAHVPRELPFIMLTMSDEDNVMNAAVALDVTVYVLKPVPQDALSMALKRATSRRLIPKPVNEYIAVDISSS
jgi:DNA-binding NarL/FixJ family response regulator